MARKARITSPKRGGTGYTPSRGFAKGQHFDSYFDYRKVYAKRAGYEGGWQDDPLHPGKFKNYGDNTYAHRQDVIKAAKNEVDLPRAKSVFAPKLRGESLLHWLIGKPDPRGEAIRLEWWLAGKRKDTEKQDRLWFEYQDMFPKKDPSEEFFYH